MNWLTDDNLFAPTKIAGMVDCYRANLNISLIASYRACININGQRIPDLPWTKPLVKSDAIISGKVFGRRMLMQMTNGIGELTACLIKNQICSMVILVFPGVMEDI